MAEVKSKVHRLAACAVVAGAVLTGCGSQADVGSQPTVAKAKLQTLAKQKLEAAAGKKAKSVDCKDGIAGKVGTTQRCVLTAKDGSKIGVTATVRAVEGSGTDARVNVDFKVDEKPLG
ncbi:DUF4333 domain-containing protein [Mycobacterium sp. 21AC1]|uniref:DUF4333 domain-containing protein n=1 Tax=[Mycobacterium] appelbergii TaxID=2939269 RepID=UPI00293919F5|nr:DUF4333 domain-containing protein [Mycobacterium sp. 21AC1]MDV3124755.1 DUF4333 domain-containing protein [Mycobacterium sp. 21AC1]